MKRLVRTLIIMLSLLMVSAGLGCAALSYYVTPTPIDKDAVQYVISAGVADANEYKGYQNLYKAEKLDKDVDYAHDIIQFNYDQLKQKDEVVYSVHKKTTVPNAELGKQREGALFGPKGLLSMGLSMVGFGTLTGFLGLARKRPQDVTPQELKDAILEAQGKAAEELTAKENQLVDVVKSVDIFMKDMKDDNPDLILDMKKLFTRIQTGATKEAVAKIKTTLPG